MHVSPTPSTGTISRKMAAIRPPEAKAMTKEKINISGQRMAMRMTIMYAFCTWVTSVVSRVTRDETETGRYSQRNIPESVQHVFSQLRAKPHEAVEQANPASTPTAGKQGHDGQHHAVTRDDRKFAPSLDLIDQPRHDKGQRAFHHHFAGDENGRLNKRFPILPHAM